MQRVGVIAKRIVETQGLERLRMIGASMGTLVPGDWGFQQIRSHLKIHARKVDRFLYSRASVLSGGPAKIPYRYEDLIPFALVVQGVRDPDVILKMTEDIYNGAIAEAVDFSPLEKREKKWENEARSFYRKYAIAEDGSYGGSD